MSSRSNSGVSPVLDSRFSPTLRSLQLPRPAARILDESQSNGEAGNSAPKKNYVMCDTRRGRSRT